jgi:transcriptional regulator with XRE-family HTH domain
MKDVREAIREYVEEHGISRQFLARKTNIEPSKISLTLSCKRGLPAEEYFLICDALNVSFDTFAKSQSA